MWNANQPAKQRARCASSGRMTRHSYIGPEGFNKAVWLAIGRLVGNVAHSEPIPPVTRRSRK